MQFRVADPAALASAILSVHGDPQALADHKSRISAPLDLSGFATEWAEACAIAFVEQQEKPHIGQRRRA